MNYFIYENLKVLINEKGADYAAKFAFELLDSTNETNETKDDNLATWNKAFIAEMKIKNVYKVPFSTIKNPVNAFQLINFFAKGEVELSYEQYFKDQSLSIKEIKRELNFAFHMRGGTVNAFNQVVITKDVESEWDYDIIETVVSVALTTKGVYQMNSNKLTSFSDIKSKYLAYTSENRVIENKKLENDFTNWVLDIYLLQLFTL